MFVFIILQCMFASVAMDEGLWFGHCIIFLSYKILACMFKSGRISSMKDKHQVFITLACYLTS